MDSFAQKEKNTENYETKEMRDLKVDYDQKGPYIFQISFPASTYLFILFNDSFQAQSKEFVRTLFHEAFSYRSDAGQCPLKGFFCLFSVHNLFQVASVSYFF